MTTSVHNIDFFPLENKLSRIIEKNKKSHFFNECQHIMAGTLLLIILSKISIPLPFTPVPITGQTLGILLLASQWQTKRNILSYFLYLLMGGLGIPVFAGSKVGLAVFLGPTMGYLIGFVVCLLVVNKLIKLLRPQNFWVLGLIFIIGTCCIYLCGAIGLSLFVPTEKIMAFGIIPFIPGAIIKMILAAKIYFWLQAKAKTLKK